MSELSAPAKSARVVHSRLAGGEAVLLHLETGQYHELDEIGALIWELIDGDRGVSEISAQLCTKVEDPPDDIEPVVTEFLESLRGRGLIT